MDAPDNNLKYTYRAAYALALVSLVFSLMVGALMVAHLMTTRTASPLNLPELDKLRADLKKSPGDEALRNKIRDFDFVVRRLYFTSMVSGRTGGVLLLVGVVFSLASLKAATVIRRKLPNPKEYPIDADPGQAVAMARWTVGGMAVILIAGAVAAGMMMRAKEKNMHPAPAKTGVVEPAPDAGDATAPWPSFRGASGSGVSAFTNVPVAWDIQSGKGILWKAGVPLPGHSSPVILRNRVVLTGATWEKREVFCYDIATGTLLWRSELNAIPDCPAVKPAVNDETGYAASTPVTDGTFIYALFANGDIGAIDHCARKKWALNLGLPANRYGLSTSLAIHDGKILAQYDQDDSEGPKSELIALDALTGKRAWETARPVSDSWPSPVVVKTAAGMQIITAAAGWIIGYAAETGKELWRVACGGSDVVPSPILAGDLVIVSVSSDKVYAIRPDGKGDVSKTHVAWTSEEGVSDVASPVSDGELVMLISSGGTLTCLEATTGRKVWVKDVEGSFYSSPGVAGDRCYLVSREGRVTVFKMGRQYEEIAKSDIGEKSDSTPAIVDGRIIIRGRENLFCIGYK